jgi:hypothetical protein
MLPREQQCYTRTARQQSCITTNSSANWQKEGLHQGWHGAVPQLLTVQAGRQQAGDLPHHQHTSNARELMCGLFD